MKRIVLVLTSIFLLAILAGGISIELDTNFLGTVLVLLAAGACVPVMSGVLYIVTPDHILWSERDNKDNMGSIRTIIYYSAIEDFDVIQVVGDPVTSNTFGETVTITGTHTFTAAGGGFFKIYGTEDTGMVEDELVGEKDGKSYRSKIKLFIPGAYAEVLGFARWAKNQGLMFIGQDAEGLFRQVGTEQYPASLDTGTITTTETSDGRKGYTIEASCASNEPSPIYTGVITEAVISS